MVQVETDDVICAQDFLYVDDVDVIVFVDLFQMELQPQASVIIETPGIDNDFGFYYDADSKETKFDCYGVGYLDEVNGISDVAWEPVGVFDKGEFIESSGVATPAPSPSENPVDETGMGGDESVPVLDCVTVVIDYEEKLLCDK